MSEQRLPPWLRKIPEWLIVAALGVAGTLIVAKVTEKRMEISYYLNSAPLVSQQIGPASSLSVLVNNIEAANPWVSTVELKNSGNSDIGSIQLGIEFHADVLQVSPGNSRIEFDENTSIITKKSRCIVSLPRLNKDESAILIAVLSKQPSQPLEVDTAEPGITLEEVSARNEGKSPNSFLLTLGIVTGTTIALLFELTRAARKDLSEIRVSLSKMGTGVTVSMDRTRGE